MILLENLAACVVSVCFCFNAHLPPCVAANGSLADLTPFTNFSSNHLKPNHCKRSSDF